MNDSAPTPTTASTTRWSQRTRLAVGGAGVATVSAAALVTTLSLAGGGAQAEPVKQPTQAGTDSGQIANACAAELRFRGKTYTLEQSGGRLIEGRGRLLGRATIPPCNDTPGAGLDDDMLQSVKVFRIKQLPGTELIYAGGATWRLVR